MPGCSDINIRAPDSRSQPSKEGFPTAEPGFIRVDQPQSPDSSGSINRRGRIHPAEQMPYRIPANFHNLHQRGVAHCSEELLKIAITILACRAGGRSVYLGRTKCMDCRRATVRRRSNEGIITQIEKLSHRAEQESALLNSPNPHWKVRAMDSGSP